MPSSTPQAPAIDIPPNLTRVYAWFSAIIANDTPLMADLLAHGLPIDVPHPLRHTTALMEATRLGRTPLVAWLLENGAAPAFLCGMPRGTPLHCAVRGHHWEIADKLLAACPNGGMVDSYSRTPLQCAEHGPA
jgi:ankyrin repeat protein